MLAFLSLTVLLTILGTEPRAEQPLYAELDPTALGLPFQRYTTKDALGRTITFYLSTPPKENAEAKLPVILFVQGSGCQSLFKKQGEKMSAGLLGLLFQVAQGRARVLGVEKPGVKYLDDPPRPGSAIGASEEFLKEHTLPRWGEANAAAVRAAWTLPGIDPSRTLVMGHSEGGLVCARVAAELSQVTHVASLAGGGPTQLFSLAELQGRVRPGEDAAAGKRRQAVYDEWAKIRAEPDSTTKFWLGHPYRRWSTFLTHSLTAELLRTNARIYLIQGTEDTASPVQAFDVVRAELTVRNRDVTAERLDGADHGFRTDKTPPGNPEGLQSAFERVTEWFLAGVRK